MELRVRAKSLIFVSSSSTALDVNELTDLITSTLVVALS